MYLPNIFTEAFSTYVLKLTISIQWLAGFSIYFRSHWPLLHQSTSWQSEEEYALCVLSLAITSAVVANENTNQMSLPYCIAQSRHATNLCSESPWAYRCESVCSLGEMLFTGCITDLTRLSALHKAYPQTSWVTQITLSLTFELTCCASQLGEDEAMESIGLRGTRDMQ